MADVTLFANGEVVEEFASALPEASVRQRLAKGLPSEDRHVD